MVKPPRNGAPNVDGRSDDGTNAEGSNRDDRLPDAAELDRLLDEHLRRLSASAGLRIVDPDAAAELVRLLDDAAARMQAIGSALVPAPAATRAPAPALGPLVVVDCRQRYVQGARRDDRWFAVRAGRT